MEGKILWRPSSEFIANSNLSRYMGWLLEKKGLAFESYAALWEWSVTERDIFWESVWQYFDVVHDGSYERVTSGAMPRTRWFEGTRLNYAEHVFRAARGNDAAIIYRHESGAAETISWTELRRQVTAVQGALRQAGIVAGDRVAAFLPCIPEATVSLLATVSLGAVWSSCSPDFGVPAVIERFAQLEPRVLVVRTGYAYNGKTFDKRPAIREILESLPSVETVIVIGGDKGMDLPRVTTLGWDRVTSSDGGILTFERVPFGHPLWVLYSSGTTGLPKGITHDHGGILLEQLKYGVFHNNYKPGERCFWYTTTGWMMWNYIHASLLAGGTMVLYDGSPAFPDLTALWKFAGEARIHHFGTSAGFILACMKDGITPSSAGDLRNLVSIGSTGSTLPPEGFTWVYRHVKADLWLTSMSGGTDVCSAFVGGNPLLPVVEGELQSRALGCSLYCYNEDGQAVVGEEGEMVITGPMPSMPVFFWNDPGFARYRESYFEHFPGVWRHGDWIRITPEGGVVIYGRSDATLNRGGVRMGSSEIYRAVETIPEIADSLIVCIEQEGGEFWMPLFVVLRPGEALTDGIRAKINQTLRQTFSPRHVPDEILAVPEVPYTISGKKTETPVKKILMGRDPSRVINRDSLRNPGALAYFIALAGERKRPGGV